jgi:hypothetical protein
MEQGIFWPSREFAFPWCDQEPWLNELLSLPDPNLKSPKSYVTIGVAGATGKTRNFGVEGFFLVWTVHHHREANNLRRGNEVTEGILHPTKLRVDLAPPQVISI